MASAEKRLESIVSNLANLNVNGFKRHGAATRSFDAVLRGQTRRQVTTKTTIDFQQGTLRPTGNTYDLALAGKGFFVLETIPSDLAGVGYYDLPIPAVPSLAGMQLHAQAIWGWSPGICSPTSIGWSSSPGLSFVLQP